MDRARPRRLAGPTSGSLSGCPRRAECDSRWRPRPVASAASEHVTEPFDLVGNSLGGAVALILALQRPELVHRLVLVAPAGFSPRPRLVADALGRLSDPMIVFRRLLGNPLTSSGIGRRLLLSGTIAAPQQLLGQE